MTITGTATTSGKGGKCRITAIATPVNMDRGTLKLWFMAGRPENDFHAGLPLCREWDGIGSGAGD